MGRYLEERESHREEGVTGSFEGEHEEDYGAESRGENEEAHDRGHHYDQDMGRDTLLNMESDAQEEHRELESDAQEEHRDIMERDDRMEIHEMNGHYDVTHENPHFEESHDESHAMGHYMTESHDQSEVLHNDHFGDHHEIPDDGDNNPYYRQIDERHSAERFEDGTEENAMEMDVGHQNIFERSSELQQDSNPIPNEERSTHILKSHMESHMESHMDLHLESHVESHLESDMDHPIESHMESHNQSTMASPRSIQIETQFSSSLLDHQIAMQSSYHTRSQRDTATNFEHSYSSPASSGNRDSDPGQNRRRRDDQDDHIDDELR